MSWANVYQRSVDRNRQMEQGSAEIDKLRCNQVWDKYEERIQIHRVGRYKHRHGKPDQIVRERRNSGGGMRL